MTIREAYNMTSNNVAVNIVPADGPAPISMHFN